MLRKFDQYRGVDIYVTVEGVFCTNEDSEVGGLKADSWVALKKKIDAAGKVRKERRPGILLGDRWGYGGRRTGSVNKVTVTSISPDPFYSKGVVCWVKHSTGDREKVNASSVLLDTPTNRKLIAAWAKLVKERARIDKEIDRLRQRMEHFTLPPPKKALTLKSKAGAANVSS